MTSHLMALRIDANAPLELARFWSGLLGWEMLEDDRDEIALLPDDDTGFRIRFTWTDEPKQGPNQMHLDLTSASPAAQRATVARTLELGGSHLDIGQGEVDHVVMADPEGNELCVIEAGNSFLADCGFIGAVSSDGTQQVGYFWSEALDWPLVWDQDEETAIRSPLGGPKITWGGPPLTPRTGPNRWHLDLVADGDLAAEVDRLVALGAQRPSDGGRSDDAVALTDPDGNPFVLHPSTGRHVTAS